MIPFVRRWWCFFFPVRGWKSRYLSFTRGRKSWPVPRRPDVPHVIPFPVEWIPHRILKENEEVNTENPVGFQFLEDVCIDTGKKLPIGVGVLCCRCGIPLHPEAASMFSGFDPPICRRCRFIVRLAG